MEIQDKLNAIDICIANNILAIIKFTDPETGINDIFQGPGKDIRVREVIASIKRVYLPDPPTVEEIDELRSIDPDFEIPEINNEEYFLEFFYEVNPQRDKYRKSNVPLKYLEITPVLSLRNDFLQSR